VSSFTPLKSSGHQLQLQRIQQVYNVILEWVGTRWGEALEISERRLFEGKVDLEGEDEEYWSLSEVLWDEVGKRLMAEMGGVIWTLGRSDMFQKVFVPLVYSVLLRFR
jgi:hypothetical protein